MTDAEQDWKRRVAALWDSLNDHDPAKFRTTIRKLADERPAGDPVAFLALALADVSREREALSLALTALSRHLPRYNRSLANYAQAIADTAR